MYELPSTETQITYTWIKDCENKETAPLHDTVLVILL